MSEKTQMPLASVTVLIDKGWTVTKHNVTPAEALLLTAEFRRVAGGEPITKIEETGSVERSASDELMRLVVQYGAVKPRALYPGTVPVLPPDFKEAVKLGMQVSLPVSQLLTVTS